MVAETKEVQSIRKIQGNKKWRRVDERLENRGEGPTRKSKRQEKREK